MSLNSEKANGAMILWETLYVRKVFGRIKPEGYTGLLPREKLSFLEKDHKNVLQLLPNFLSTDFNH